MAARYWVGGAGSWASTAKWSASSGGTGGQSVPTAADDVYFDGASGLTAGGTITIDPLTATCANLNIGLASNIITTNGALVTFSIYGGLNIVGSIIQHNSATSTANKRILFRGITTGTYAEQRGVLTVGSVQGTLTDIDFANINVRGAAVPLSGTRIGDRGCNTGITFSPAKKVYWNYIGSGTQVWQNSAGCWAATSGGTPDVNNFPLAQDTAVFDDNSSLAITTTGSNMTTTAVTCLTGTNIINYVGSIDMSARTRSGGGEQLTFASWGTNMIVHGDVKLCSSVTFTSPGTTTFAGKWGKVQTIDSAGVTWPGSITVNSPGGFVQLASNLTMGAAATLLISDGTFDTRGYNFTGYNISMSAAYYSSRVLMLRSSTVSLSSPTPFAQMTTRGAVIYPETSQINLTSTAAITFWGNGLNFNNVSFTGATGGTITHLIRDSNTFNNLTFTAPTAVGFLQCNIYNNQTITGTLTCAGSSPINRIWLYSDTIGYPRTLTVGSIIATDCDFRDITIAGAAAGSSITRAGNCGGNTGITFPAAKTVYWNLAGTQNWSATGWAGSSGGTPAINNFPLPQDTAVFDNTGSAGTVTFDMAWNVGTISAGSRSSSMTISFATYTPLFYGGWTSGSGLSITTSAIPLTFAGRGTNTVNGNSVSFGISMVINCYTGTVQLGGDFSLSSTYTLTLTSGTFDAVTYNVTADSFSSSNSNSRSLKMGTGQWTLAGTGSVWNTITNTNLLFYKGTASILLSDASATARTFTSNGLYFNKLTIGGAVGSSTTSFDTCHFTELASTKLVAHTIDFATYTVSAITLGAWTVTGNSNYAGTYVVTVTGSPAITIAGARVSGVNYLDMGTVTVPALSPGEFYAGANSTGTNSGANGAAGSTLSGVILTAAPAAVTRYWVGGAGTWDTTTTTNWSATSNGAGGASVPTSADAVIFDANSGTAPYTITFFPAAGTVLRTGSFNTVALTAGAVTFATGGNGTWIAHGSITFGTSASFSSWLSDLVLSGNTKNVFTPNGFGIYGGPIGIEINATGGSWSLGSTLTITATGSLIVTNGSFDTGANYNISVTGGITSSNSNARTISFGSSIVTIQSGGGSLTFGGATPLLGNVPDNLNFSVGLTQTINLPTTASAFYGGSKTFYNVTWAGVTQLYGTNTFLGNVSFSSPVTAGTPGISTVTLYANQTIRRFIYATKDYAGTRRLLLASDTLGVQRTITLLAPLTSYSTNGGPWNDIDFRDIAIAGYPVSGDRMGDCRNNTVPTSYTSGGTIFLDSNWPVSVNQTPGFGVTATSNNFIFTGDFTVEGWFYFARYQRNPYYKLIQIGSGGTTSGGRSFYVYTTLAFCYVSGDPAFAISGSGSGVYIAGPGWNHVAVQRRGSEVNFYFNGYISNRNDTGITGTVGDGTITFGSLPGDTTSINGYMKNLRVSNVAVYTPTSFYASTPAIAFFPQSTFSPTQTASIGSYLSPVYQDSIPALYSYSFNGTSNYLRAAYKAGHDIGFYTPMTFECWVYTSSTNTFFMASRNWTSYPSGGPTWAFILENGVSPRWQFGGTGYASNYVTGPAALKGPLSQWNHYAFTRDSASTVRVFVNGTLDITTVRYEFYSMSDASSDIYIGAPANLAAYSNGYMSNMRLVVGTCLYTQNFQPLPAQPLTAVSNTSILTMHASTIIDGSSTPSTITNPTSMSVVLPAANAITSGQTLLLLNVNDSANMLTDSSQYNVPVTNNGNNAVYSTNGLPLNGIVFQPPRTLYMNYAGSKVWGVNASNLWVQYSTMVANTAAITPDPISNPPPGMPLAQDTAVITSRSGITTLTIDNAWHIGSIDFTDAGTMTFATGTQAPTIYGNVTLASTIAVSGTGALTFSGQGKTQNITSAGKTFTQPLTINSPNGGVVQLIDNLAINGVTGALTLTQGGLIAKANVSTGVFSSNNTNIRSIGFGSGTWSLSGTGTMWNVNTGNLTTDPGSATISLNGAYAAAGVFSGAGGSWPTLMPNTAANNTTLTITAATPANASVSGTSFTDIVNGNPALYKIIALGSGLVTVSSLSLKYSALNTGYLVYTGNSSTPGADGLLMNNVRAYGTTATTNASGIYISSTSNVTVLNWSGPGLFVSSSTPVTNYSVVVQPGVVFGNGVTLEVSPPPTPPTFSYLVIAGGGAGGTSIGGGGGGGGVVIGTATISYGVAYNIIVGAGGTAVAFNNITAATGNNGGQSQISGIATADGGGGGGAYTSTGSVSNGSAGGSGGGGAGGGSGQGRSGGSATQGKAGGANWAQDGGGAGGGGGGFTIPGTAGVTTNVAGKGGDGILNDYSGTATYYAGGGGGCGGTSGAGGLGGGGAGSFTTGTNGTPNTGGGGGGGDTGSGGAGGSGIVIIRYPSTYPDAVSVTGATYTNTGVYKIYKWTTPNATSSGTITF